MRETVLFALLGAVMFISKVILEIVPNVHLLGMFIMTFTLVFRKKALFPIYIFVLINGIFAGFAAWWVPYLYIWTILWAVTMALPKNMSRKKQCLVYPAVCCLHGLLYGTLYAPCQALVTGMSLKGMMAWIIAGLPFDAMHAAGNLAAGFLVVPLSETLRTLAGKYGFQ